MNPREVARTSCPDFENIVLCCFCFMLLIQHCKAPLLHVSMEFQEMIINQFSPNQCISSRIRDSPEHFLFYFSLSTFLPLAKKVNYFIKPQIVCIFLSISVMEAQIYGQHFSICYLQRRFYTGLSIYNHLF